MQSPSIIVKDLRIAIQDTLVLDGVSFSLFKGQHLAITGGAESGKTSLAKALAGKIHVSGNVTLQTNSSRPAKVGLVEQRYVFKNLSGISDFYYQQRFNSFAAEDAPTVTMELLSLLTDGDKNAANIKKVEENLDRLGILYLKDAPLIQLSSGEHKRFQLIKALINPPDILILDSPYLGLDVASRAGLNDILHEVTSAGTQLIIIPGTFDLPDCVTHVAFLEDRQMKFFGERQKAKGHQIKEHRLQHSNVFNLDSLPATPGNSCHGTLIEMVNVHISYGNKSIIENINWKVESGDKWLLKGKNGSGKSSLLNLVTGDHPQAYSNEIYLFGKRRGTGESIWDIKQKIGYVSPELHAYFDKDISVFQATGSGFFDTIGLYRKLTADQHKTILQWLDFLHLSHVQNKPLHCISTSQQRLTLLARVLVKNPPLLILDEPCQGLDLDQRDQFISLIDGICEALDKTLIYVSHNDEEIPACIEKVLELDHHKQTIYLKQKQAVLETAF